MIPSTSQEIELPVFAVKTTSSEFRLRCHAAAWASEYGGWAKLGRRRSFNCPGLLVLSVTGPDTAAKALRATLYQPEVEAEFHLEGRDWSERMLRASLDFDGKPVTYRAAVTKLAPGVIHLVALARIPGLMPDLSDDHLWAELCGPRYTTPLLRSWTGWLKRAMTEDGQIIVAQGYEAEAGVLKAEPEDLDALVGVGVKHGHLRMLA